MNGHRSLRGLILEFLAAPAFAVVGASNHMEKYGAQVFACYLEHGRMAYPIHPREKYVQGRPAYRSLRQLPQMVESVSVVTHPEISLEIVEEAGAAGVKRLWFQPGAENAAVLDRARDLGIDVIAGGPCVLVELGALD